MSRIGREQHANMLKAADLFRTNHVSLPLCFMPSAFLVRLFFLQSDQVIAHLSVAPPPALLYLHRYCWCLKCFYLPDK